MKKELLWNTTDPIRGSIYLNTFDDEDVEHVLDEIMERGDGEKRIVQTTINAANQCLYGKGSIRYGYWRSRADVKAMKESHPDVFAAGRQVWMRQVLSSLYFFFPLDVQTLIAEVYPLAPVPEMWVAVEAHRALAGLPAENERAREEACKRLPTVDAATKVAKLKRRKKGGK